MSNSEYISRDAVDTKLLAMEERVIDNPFALTAIAMVMNEIDKITAADVAPVVYGHWIKQTVSSGRDSWQCSICGRKARGKRENLPYCHCGAKMDEEKKEDDGSAKVQR